VRLIPSTEIEPLKTIPEPEPRDPPVDRTLGKASGRRKKPAKSGDPGRLTDASDIQILRDVSDSYLNREQPPASTLVIVKQLLRPELLIEVDAIAVTKD
jgi:hypothetical protein